MSKQWQLRRGTKAENDIFTGAEGEVTMCTDTKSLRVHDGTTQGGFDIDTVVAFQIPTAENNYKWYRKYASGWVEQGGQFTAQGGQYSVYQVTPLPVTMADSNYYVNGIVKYSSADNTLTVSIDSTTTSATVLGIRKHWSSTGQTIIWEVKGMAA